MRKVTSLFLALLLCIAMTTSAVAATTDNSFEDTAYPSPNTEHMGEETFTAPASAPKMFANGAIRVYPLNRESSGSANLTGTENTLYSQRGEGPIADMLVNAGDVHSYTIEIDHTVASTPLIFAYPFITTKDFAFSIRCESNQAIFEAETELNTSNFIPKAFMPFPSHENDIETYTLSIVALEDATGYAFTLGARETFADDFGGMKTIPTVPKNSPVQIKSPRFFRGYQALLNTGEWFHYRADGETYITAGMSKWTDLAFAVYDLDTGGLFYRTTPDDCLTVHLSDTIWDGYVSKRLDLEAGKDYAIEFYSTRTVSVPDEKLFGSPYNIWIGLPNFRSEPVDYSSSPYRLPANTTRTFTFKVSGFPESMRVSDGTRFTVGGSNSSGYISATGCKITAPNGYTFTAPYGSKTGMPYPVVENYLNSPSNMPINGEWKVTVSAIREIPDLRFKISNKAMMIVGNDVN